MTTDYDVGEKRSQYVQDAMAKLEPALDQLSEKIDKADEHDEDIVYLSWARKDINGAMTQLKEEIEESVWGRSKKILKYLVMAYKYLTGIPGCSEVLHRLKDAMVIYAVYDHGHDRESVVCVKSREFNQQEDATIEQLRSKILHCYSKNFGGLPG